VIVTNLGKPLTIRDRNAAVHRLGQPRRTDQPTTGTLSGRVRKILKNLARCKWTISAG